MAQPTLEIFSPMANKGLGRKYTARTKVVDETNYIDLGLIIHDPEGKKPKHNIKVNIQCTDETQDRELRGTGNIRKMYKEDIKEIVHYYPFHYEFRTAGQHIITFKVLGVTESVELDVIEPEPA